MNIGNRQKTVWTANQRKAGFNQPYMRLSEIYLGYAEACAATDPPICTEETFGDMEGVTLYVPMNCADKYKQKCGWRNFSAIVEVIPAGIVNVDTVPETIIQNHNLQGIRIKSNLYRGIYIQNGKKFVVK